MEMQCKVRNISQRAYLGWYRKLSFNRNMVRKNIVFDMGLESNS